MIFILTALLMISASSEAMSYEQARREALFLTDKMAYELNLNDSQYEAAYEINLDYLMGVTGVNNVYGSYWERRNLDMSYILFDWQWTLFKAATYFFRPLYWSAGNWHFGIYVRYPHRHHFYFTRPAAFVSYRGGHGIRHHHTNYYHNHTNHYRPAKGHNGMRDRYDKGAFDNKRPNGNKHNGSFGNNRNNGNNQGNSSRPGSSFGKDRNNDNKRPSSGFGNDRSKNDNKKYNSSSSSNSRPFSSALSGSSNRKSLNSSFAGSSNSIKKTSVFNSRPSSNSSNRGSFTPRQSSSSSRSSFTPRSNNSNRAGSTVHSSSSGGSRSGSTVRSSSSGSSRNGNFGGRR